MATLSLASFISILQGFFRVGQYSYFLQAVNKNTIEFIARFILSHGKDKLVK